MKRIIYLCAAVLGLSSCEKFFEREPENKFAANLFFKTETDLQSYTNGLIDTALPDADAIALGSDVYTDFCGTKDSKQFFQPDRYTAAIASGWSYSNWSFLRRVAYMLDNMSNARGNVSDAKYNHYEGVARYFRAMATFNKVKKFGDVYWIDHVISPDDSALLYGPRQDREFIMHKVVEDLDFACTNCLADGVGVNTDGRVYINRYVALAMASRICLYEGTFRKYHSVNPSTGKTWNGEYESADDLLTLAMKYAGEIMESGKFSLNPDFRALFTSAKLPTDEVIWGKTYSEELGIKHSVTYKYCSTTSSQLYSPTKDYVMMFLRSDGKPVETGAVSMTEEFKSRDRRRTATVLGPGQKMKDQKGASVDFAPDFTWTVSGYLWMKWVMPEYAAMNSSANMSVNSMPVLRYGEVLLNYAEAAAELGKMTESIWNSTIGELRKVHGGISNSAYPGSAGYAADSWLRKYYTEDVLHPSSLTDIQLEIRRERAVELMLEQDSRYDDLMRWNLGDLIERRYAHKGWRGMYVTEDEAKNGFDFNGKHYTVSTTRTSSETNYKITTSDDRGVTLSEGKYGYVIYNYRLQWDDKMYLSPIPVSASNVNPELGQNEGWQWL